MKAIRENGFTLVELLVVIAIIGVLASIVILATAGAMSSARTRRQEAMKVVLEQGIATFYAQRHKWPKAIDDRIDEFAESGKPRHRLSNSEADSVFREVVGAAWGKSQSGSGGKSMMLDATGLYVCEASKCGNGGNGCADNHDDPSSASYCRGKGCRAGISFADAVKKNGKRHIRLSEMAFGYQGSHEGMFRRFYIWYNVKTDSVTVEEK